MCKEVISIHIGQTGIQTGTAMWELFLLEHDIDIDGQTINDINNDSFEFKEMNFRQMFFSETNNNHYFPRALFLDSEPNVINELKTGVYHNLFSSQYFINSFIEGGGNFARGCYSLGPKLMHQTINRIRHMVEACDLFQGFILHQNISGGTGSGLSAILMHSLSHDYEKSLKFQQQVISGTRLQSNVVEPYNSTLNIHNTLDTGNLAFLIENNSLYRMCREYLLKYSPYYTDINRVMALMFSSVTSTMRFSSYSHSDLNDILTNLVPFPRVHFTDISHAPFIPVSRRTYHHMDIPKLLDQVFSKCNSSMSFEKGRGAIISLMMIARGDITNMEICHSLNTFKRKHKMAFVEWTPTGYKLSINQRIPETIPEMGMANFGRSLTVMTNSSSLKELWDNMGRKFDLLYEKKAYLHWFLDEGLEQAEFIDARINLAMLWEEYEEMSMSQEELDYFLDRTRKSTIRRNSELKSISLRRSNESRNDSLFDRKSFPSISEGPRASIAKLRPLDMDNHRFSYAKLKTFEEPNEQENDPGRSRHKETYSDVDSIII